MGDFGFWIAAGLIGFATAAILLRAAARAELGSDASAKSMALYRAQLSEIESDLSKGTVEPAEAERLRTEVQRRILETARKDDGPHAYADTGWGQGLGLASVIAALIGAFAAYTWLGAPDYPDLPLTKRLAMSQTAYDARPSQAEAEAAALPAPPLPVDPEFTALIEKLRAAVAARPDDITGLTLLARNEAQLGNFAASARAYEALIAAKGDSAAAEDYLGAAQAMIAAAGGTVTPEAEAALAQTLQKDPENGLAQYFSGLMFAQIGRPDRAFALWEPLVAIKDAPWSGPITSLLPEVAAAAGIKYTLPEAEREILAGPSASDIESAADMSAEDRRVMINTMVTGLEERLLSEGGTAAEWARLVSSLGILNETGRAKVALAAGMAALKDDAAGLAALQDAAKGLTP